MPSSASGKTAFYTCTWYVFRSPFEVIPSFPPNLCVQRVFTRKTKLQLHLICTEERKGGEKMKRRDKEEKTEGELGEKTERKEQWTEEEEFKPDLWTRTFYSSLTKGLSTWESQGKGSGSVNFQHTFFQQTKLTCPTGALSAHSASTGGVSAEQLACCKFTP